MSPEIVKSEPMPNLTTSRYNMAGQEITEKGEIIENGRVCFGTNMILDYGCKFAFLIQDFKEPKCIELKAKTQRAARVELNKMFPALRNAYVKPRFVPIAHYEALKTKSKIDRTNQLGDWLK